MTEKELNATDLPWGKLYPIFQTEEFDVSLETIEPGKRIPPYYYKTGSEIIYILEGKGKAKGRKAEKGDLFHIKPRQIFKLDNSSMKQMRFLAICIPPYNEKDCVWIEGKK